MSPIPINLAVEDQLSESVLRSLLRLIDRDYHIGTSYSRGGFGYLQRTANGFNQAARGTPFLLLTDLDDGTCPPELIRDWVRGPLHPNFILRVAVREVEAWLLADPENLARFLTVRGSFMPPTNENLDDPKQVLVEIARHARSKDIRERVVPKAGSTARQGPDYNSCLSQFVETQWDINAACNSSASLKSAVERLRTFEPTWE